GEGRALRWSVGSQIGGGKDDESDRRRHVAAPGIAKGALERLIPRSGSRAEDDRGKPAAREAFGDGGDVLRARERPDLDGPEAVFGVRCSALGPAASLLRSSALIPRPSSLIPHP